MQHKKNGVVSGLMNMGNTCYMNAALQALAHTDTLLAYLMDNNTSIAKDINNTALDEIVKEEELKKKELLDTFDIEDSKVTQKVATSLTQQLRILFTHMWESPNVFLHPMSMRIAIIRQLPFFANNFQHDSHDILFALLNKIHDETKADRGKICRIMSDSDTNLLNTIKEMRSAYIKSGITHDEKVSIIAKTKELVEKDADAYYNALLMCEIEDRFSSKVNGFSKIDEIFKVILLNIIECTTCHNISAKFEFENNINLAMQIIGNTNDNNEIHLNTILEKYTNFEALTDNNKYECDYCNEKRDAMQRTLIYHASDKLILLLKKYDNNSNILRTKVKYEHNLDISNYLYKPQKQTYELYATLTHIGNVNGGHYYAYCKNPLKQQWYECNDTNVMPVGANDVLESNSYVLLFQMT